MAIRKKTYGAQWQISWDEYRELHYFCLQYNRKKADAAALLTLRISTPPPVTDADGNGVFLPHASGATSDPVAAQAAKRDRLLRDVDMIDRAAQLAAGDLAPWLIKCVTTKGGTRSIIADCPASERSMWYIRRQFFYILKQFRDAV